VGTDDAGGTGIAVEWLVALDRGSREALLAHVVAMSVNALILPHERRAKAIADADRLAQACDLAMRDYWSPTVERYLGRVTKAGILEAVREGVSIEAAERLSGLRKPDMAREAQSLLSESPWLPACLRTPVRQAPEAEPIMFAQAAE